MWPNHVSWVYPDHPQVSKIIIPLSIKIKDPTAFPLIMLSFRFCFCKFPAQFETKEGSITIKKHVIKSEYNVFHTKIKFHKKEASIKNICQRKI